MSKKSNELIRQHQQALKNTTFTEKKSNQISINPIATIQKIKSRINIKIDDNEFSLDIFIPNSDKHIHFAVDEKKRKIR